MSLFSLGHYYVVFRKLAGRRLPLLLFAVTIGGLLESVGVGIFVPLLSFDSGVAGPPDLLTGFFRRVASLFGVALSLNFLLVLIVAVFLAKGVVSLWQAAVSARITATLTFDLRQRLVALLSHTTYENFLGLNTGLINNVVTTEVDRAVACFSHYTLTIVSLVYAVAYVALALIIDWRGAALVTLLGLGAVLSLSTLHRYSGHYSRLTTQTNSSLQDLLIQTIRSFKYLRATNSFPKVVRKIETDIEALATYVFRLSMISAVFRAIIEPVGVLILVVLLFVNVSIGGRPLTDMLILGLVFYRLMARLMGVQANWQKFNALVGGLDAVDQVSTVLQRSIEPVRGEAVSALNDRIVLREVTFSYRDQRVLHDVNIDVAKNTTVALVGKTGSGKSTIIGLILGFLEPESGAVLFDGTPYARIDLLSLRDLVGYVTQEDVVFRDSIRNNISLWQCPSGDLECQKRIKGVIREVHVEELIESFQDGIETMLGDGGNTISGGQRQQIALARELFRGPEILILDEAMSALDAKSEWRIQQSLAEWKGKRTILVVTHRLQSVRDCDYIYVLNEGRVVEEGTYEELYRQSQSSFSELARLQGL